MIRRLAPGLALCIAVAAAASGLEWSERAATGRAWVDALVIAILLGTVVRTAWALPDHMRPGVDFAAKPLLEVAIVLLGLTLDVPLLVRTGPALLGAVIVTVAVALSAVYFLGRALGLAPRLAALVAIGNAICGNSAIAAAAPVIGADADDVAAAIAFTAVLGIAVVLLLPFVGAGMSLDPRQYGVVAGLTVYAVPQVLAATLPVSSLSGDVGTLVKLTRVLLLGPVLVGCGIWARTTFGARTTSGGAQGRPTLMPWFIAGFLVMAALRGVGAVPPVLIAPVRDVARLLTIVALAALGLGVNLGALRTVGPRVAAAAACGILVLGTIAIVLARTLIT